MTEIKQPFLDEAARAAGYSGYRILPNVATYAAQSIRAHAATLQAHADYRARVEVMAAEVDQITDVDWFKCTTLAQHVKLVIQPFLAPKPVDPVKAALREVFHEAFPYCKPEKLDRVCGDVGTALAKRGLEIKVKEGGE